MINSHYPRKTTVTTHLTPAYHFSHPRRPRSPPSPLDRSSPLSPPIHPNLRPTAPQNESIARTAPRRPTFARRRRRSSLFILQTGTTQAASGASRGLARPSRCLTSRQGSELDHSAWRQFNRASYSPSLVGAYVRTIRPILSAKLLQQT